MTRPSVALLGGGSRRAGKARSARLAELARLSGGDTFHEFSAGPLSLRVPYDIALNHLDDAELDACADGLRRLSTVALLAMAKLCFFQGSGLLTTRDRLELLVQHVKDTLQGIDVLAAAHGTLQVGVAQSRDGAAGSRVGARERDGQPLGQVGDVAQSDGRGVDAVDGVGHPSPFTVYLLDDGVSRRRAGSASLTVDPLTDGRRRVEVIDDIQDYHVIFDLSAAQAKHLIGLLSPAPAASGRTA